MVLNAWITEIAKFSNKIFWLYEVGLALFILILQTFRETNLDWTMLKEVLLLVLYNPF